MKVSASIIPVSVSPVFPSSAPGPGAQSGRERDSDLEEWVSAFQDMTAQACQAGAAKPNQPSQVLSSVCRDLTWLGEIPCLHWTPELWPQSASDRCRALSSGHPTHDGLTSVLPDIRNPINYCNVNRKLPSNLNSWRVTSHKMIVRGHPVHNSGQSEQLKVEISQRGLRQTICFSWHLTLHHSWTKCLDCHI